MGESALKATASWLANSPSDPERRLRQGISGMRCWMVQAIPQQETTEAVWNRRLCVLLDQAQKPAQVPSRAQGLAEQGPRDSKITGHFLGYGINSRLDVTA